MKTVCLFASPTDIVEKQEFGKADYLNLKRNHPINLKRGRKTQLWGDGRGEWGWGGVGGKEEEKK